MTELNEVIFKKDIYNTTISTHRQNLQIEYTKRLINMLANHKYHQGHSNIVKSMLLYNLRGISKKCSVRNGSLQTRAHKDYLKTIIDSALEEL